MWRPVIGKKKKLKTRNSHSTMGTGNPIEVLKRGLKVLETRIKAKRHDLMSKVAVKTKISEEEEECLDEGGGNMVDEVRVIDKLEKHLTMSVASGGWTRNPRQLYKSFGPNMREKMHTARAVMMWMTHHCITM